MSVTVVGSIAYDRVKTPFGERERMLGGAATHFALAASFFDDVRVVGPVGDDFADEDMATLATRGTSTEDVERVAGGKTFFWAGEYGWDLNSRETLDTQLGVFDLRAQAQPGEPRGRRPVPRQHPARPPALGARAVRGGAVRRARLDEPVDRHRA